MRQFATALLAMIGFANAQTGKVRVDPETRTLRDETGRSILFHGVNVVYKVDPYIPSMDGPFDPQLSLNAEDIQSLQDWGMNFVRLGVMWEAVERTRGIIDTVYLGKVEQLINALGEKGIYTLVDMHQDVFARTICGEGFPDFYAKEALGEHPHCINGWIDPLLAKIYDMTGVCVSIDSYGFRKDENDDPLIEDCQTVDFYKFYMTKESINAFDALYTNKGGLRDKFVDYWDVTSARFAANPYVVGFDPLNEPFPGNFVNNPAILAPGHMDRNELNPMYELIQEKYMTNSNGESAMWFMPASFPDEVGLGPLGGVVFPVGFETPPGGEIGSPNHVLNDHTYCCQLSPSICATGEPSTNKAQECLKWHYNRMGQRADDAKRLGVPFHLTEFGACLTEGPCTQEINQVTDIADHHLYGWAYWQLKTYADLTTSAGTGSEGFWNQDGSLQEWKVKALARTYSMATQGTLTLQSFNTENADFYCEFTVNKNHGPTQIYANAQYWYPNGFDFEIIDKENSKILKANQYELVNIEDSRYLQFSVVDTELDGKTIAVSISAI